jgi:hypothetical protein
LRVWCGVLADVRLVAVAPVASIPIVHELADGIELERRDAIDWAGTAAARSPLLIRHERGNARPVGMRPVLDVPPWCTFHIDSRGEPASLFHGIFGEVDRLLACEEPGRTYVVRYGEQPSAPVIALQSELAAFSFALSARDLGLIAHACAFVTRGGDGVLCPGVSGTGKTTLARLLSARVPDVKLFTDDRAIVTLDDGQLLVWGSPWPGAARVAGDGSAPLRTVVFIRHDTTCALQRVAPGDAFRRILSTLSMPVWEPARCGRALEIVDAIVTTAELLEIRYPPTPSAAAWLATAVERSQPLGTRDAD